MSTPAPEVVAPESAAGPDAVPAPDARPTLRERSARWLAAALHPPLPATVGAVVLFWLSLTPSLLPRSVLSQTIISTLCALAGYGIGGLLGWLVGAFGVHVTGRARQVIGRGLGVLGLLGTVVACWWGLGWENEVRDLVGTPDVGWAHVLGVLVLTGVAVTLLVFAARLVRLVGRILGRIIDTVLPKGPAMVLGALVALALTWWLAVGVGGTRLLETLDGTFRLVNDELTSDLPAPTAPELSAGPASNETWGDLGRYGRAFMANSPSAADIAEFSGSEAMHPVRAYVGGGQDGLELDDAAARAVAELEALGGFDRAVLNVVTGTGRGWVNENQAQALEYLWGGDVATVSIQYSYLPSWMSFLFDGARAKDAGRELFDAVHEHWLTLPEDERPQLVVSGESLGSFGGEAAFSGEQDLAARTSGALFVGPTANNALWARFTADRDTGSPQVLPSYQSGDIVRFADTDTDWTTLGEWPGPRIGYLQHANDPITWWDVGLAWHRPDWLEESPGRDVSDSMTWIPGVTMLQVGIDQLAANDVPQGQGHQFGQEPVAAWAQILPPPGWDAADTVRLQEVLAAKSPVL